MLTTSPNTSVPKVFRLRPAAGLDSYGEPVRNGAEDRSRLPNVLEVQEVSSGETDQAGRPILLRNERRLLVRGSADLTATDRVEIDGEKWRVDGTPIVRRGLASGQFTSARLVRLT